ncbi:uncharacterized protein LOC135463144 [Liolophura sinensis]|uniref:uncharacterized protein LOC135463144 n=1 Tax=Liolophura sinensis TaxID=3198878 RepID=UPI0031586128
MEHLIVLLSLTSCLWGSLTAFDGDPSVCSPVSDADSKGGPKKPVLAKTYTARVECNLMDRNYTTDVIEYFDQQHNRGSVVQTQDNSTGQLIYNYDTNEIFTVDLTDNTCTADALTTDENNFLFGFKAVNSSMSRIFTANGALRFGGDTKEKYLGKFVVRGIRVDGWQSCTYWPSLQATSLVKWYFTDSSGWQEAIDEDQLPVRCEITGRGQDDTGQMHSYHHIYEFSHYRPYIDTADKVFEVPAGTLCPGRKMSKKLPTPSNYFNFEAEVVIPEAKIISHQQQWYDFTTKLFRYDWKPLGGISSSQFGNNPLTTIHDFNTGVSYNTDRLLGNCTATVIDPTAVDAVKVDDNTVRMRTPAEFFDFNIGSFQYEGVRQAHGVDSHVWITFRDDWPPDAQVPSSWEWYFATKEWIQGSGNLYEAGEPQRLEIRVNNELYAVYNIYNYNEAEPVMWEYDISDCFSSSQKRHFQFELPGDFKSIVMSDEEGFKYAVLLSVIGYTAISPVRVSDIQVDYDETAIRVTFTMLDAAPPGGDVNKGATETPLDDAANIFFNSVQDGQFVVDMPVKSLTEPLHLTAKPTPKELEVREYLKNPIPPSSTGYNAGSMAALGVVMAIIGFALGGAIVYLVYRKNGGSFSKNAPQSFDNPVSDSKE